jgi:hypothetical protein
MEPKPPGDRFAVGVHPGITQEESMQKILLGLGLAAGVALVCSSAGAVPMSVTAVKQAVAAASPVQQAQFTEHRTRHGVVKCYRDLVIGPYRCHYFRNGVFNPFSF